MKSFGEGTVSAEVETAVNTRMKKSGRFIARYLTLNRSLIKTTLKP